jgi:predicted DNA binding CopG/RHH family protein
LKSGKYHFRITGASLLFKVSTRDAKLALLFVAYLSRALRIAVMTITIDLPPDVEASVKTQAAKEGLPLEDYVTSLVQEGTQRRDRIDLLAERPFAEILAPFRRNVEDSGLGDKELDDLVTTARQEVARARKGRARG